MTLPNVHRHDMQQWKELHDQASTPDGKAIVGALMLVVSAIEMVYDAIVSSEPEGPS